MSKEPSVTRSYLPYCLAGLIILLLLAGLMMRLAASYYLGGYTWVESDWNSDGSTSVSEYLEGSEVGDRPGCISGQPCTHYFWLKDGLDFKTVCPERVQTGRGKFHMQREKAC